MSSVDIDDLRVDLGVATEQALALADEIEAAITAGRASTPLVLSLAVDYREKRQEIKRLRRAIQVEVAG